MSPRNLQLGRVIRWNIAPMPMRSPWCAGFVARCHPDAEAALLAGSRSRGTDYDVILLFGELPNGAWRETSAFEEQVIETFALRSRGVASRTP